MQGYFNGAESRARTDDLFFTKELLYQLSYFGITITIACYGFGVFGVRDLRTCLIVLSFTVLINSEGVCG